MKRENLKPIDLGNTVTEALPLSNVFTLVIKE